MAMVIFILLLAFFAFLDGDSSGVEAIFKGICIIIAFIVFGSITVFIMDNIIIILDIILIAIVAAIIYHLVKKHKSKNGFQETKYGNGIHKNNQNKKGVVYCCKKCGTVKVLSKRLQGQKVVCSFCNSQMRNLQNDINYFVSKTDKKYSTWQEVVRKQYAKPRHRDAELYEKREIYEASLIKETPDKHSKVEQKKQQEEIQKLKNNSNTTNKDEYIPKCPNCGSTAITSSARGINIVWGFIGASKTVNRCANCGHMWKPKK